MHLRSLSLAVLALEAATLSAFAVTSCGTLAPDSVPAKGDPAGTVPADGNDTGTVTAKGGEASNDGGLCPVEDASLASNGNGPGQVAASGKAESDSVDCTFCGVGVSLAISTEPDVATLYIEPSVAQTASSCSTPSDASSVWISGQFAISAAKPGVYQATPNSPVRSNNAYCNDLTISYDLPYEAGTVIIDCGDSGPFYGPPSCPTGCISSCLLTSDGGDGGEFCSACESTQSQPNVQYRLQNGCENETPRWGSWTVTLTSVVPAEVPADAGVLPGVVIYTVHGSLTATLLDGYDRNAPTPSVTLTLAF